MLTLIGDGKKTCLWLDKWHPTGVFSKQYGDRIRYDTGMYRLSTVNNIMRSGAWQPPPAVPLDLVEAWSALLSIGRLGLTNKEWFGQLHQMESLHQNLHGTWSGR